jgi:N-acetylglucosaminyldiphosphoundecaprenol N-acetyl-beta-D-mannosaminyltransferase
VVIAGCYAGSPRPEDEPAIHERILAAKPDILLVAYGAPAQELWIARNQPLLGVPAAIGVGGTFDYLAGHVPRAPRWMRRLGLEWLFRLIRQPWRWRRIWTAVVSFPLAVWRDQRRRGVRSS